MDELSLLNQMLTVLQALPAGRVQWSDIRRGEYLRFMVEVSAHVAIRAAQEAVRQCLPFVPEPPELRRIAARLESPYPDAADAYAEMAKAKVSPGLYCHRDPNLPLWLEGTPDFSHPLITLTVKTLGGWRTICEGDAQYQTGGERGAFLVAYEHHARDWEDACLPFLRYPIAERPRGLFPGYVPLTIADRLASLSIAGVAFVGNAERRVIAPPVAPMPAAVRDRIRALAAHMAMPDPSDQMGQTDILDEGAVGSMVSGDAQEEDR